MIQPRTNTPNTHGMTGRALVDPEPLISEAQAKADRDVFMANAKARREAQDKPRHQVKEAPKPRSIQPRSTQPQSIKPRPIKRIDELMPRAKELREMGCSDGYIAETLHVTRRAIVNRLGPPNRKKNQALPDDERLSKQEIAAQMKEQGATYAEIALRVGVTKQAVSYWFTKGALAA